MAQIEVTNEGGEAIAGDSPVVTVAASGSGRDDTDVAGVRLYHDADGDGRLDAGEPQRGSEGTFGADDGTVTFDFGVAGSPPGLSSGATVNYLVVYDFASRLADRGPIRIDAGMALAGVAGGGGALVLLGGVFGGATVRRRRALWLPPLAAALLAVAACGGGGSGGDGSSDGGDGGPGTDTQAETFTATLEDVTVTTTGGRTLDIRTPPVQGATVTVEE
ncbi:MAG: hypothetical protein U5K43_01795 [Halofilum sp. (in: g-proteobacteria)]|nr:hypothetical protein [Halofilum sp. (in: g-proteobacteria)]